MSVSFVTSVQRPRPIGHLLTSATALCMTWAVSVACASAADEDSPVRQRGDHPAVVVQRLQQKAGYDYASKFYPHPAWLYLRSVPPSQASSSRAQSEQAPDLPAASARATVPSLGG